jgi:hypothetical protein
MHPFDVGAVILIYSSFLKDNLVQVALAACVGFREVSITLVLKKKQPRGVWLI